MPHTSMPFLCDSWEPECVNMGDMQTFLHVFKWSVLTLTWEMHMQIHWATFITPHLGSWCIRSCVWRAGRPARSLRSHTAGWGIGRGCQGPNGNCSTHRLTGGRAPVREWNDGRGWVKENEEKREIRWTGRSEPGDWNTMGRRGWGVWRRRRSWENFRGWKWGREVENRQMVHEGGGRCELIKGGGKSRRISLKEVIHSPLS